jgi:hypothetical protein
MKIINVYKVRFQDGDTYYFKGINALREFAKERIADGWETDTKEDDLNDDNKVIDFLVNDYGEEVSIVMTINESDLK